jgi:hypothetical protein
MTEWSFNRQVVNAIVAGLIVSASGYIGPLFFITRAHHEDLSGPLLLLALGMSVVMVCSLFLFLFCWGAAAALLARKSGWTEQRALKIARVPAYLGLIALVLGGFVLFYDLPLPRYMTLWGTPLFFCGRYSVTTCRNVFATIVASPAPRSDEALQNASAH